MKGLDLLTSTELKEHLYEKTKTITSQLSLTKRSFETHEVGWFETRGNLFSIIASLNDLNYFIKEAGSWDKRLTGLPIDLTKLEMRNRRWLETLGPLANRDIRSDIATPDDITVNILKTCTEIWNEYNYALPLLGKFMDNQLGFPLSRISDSLDDYKQFFSGNWTTAVVHLAMMDSIVNKVRDKLGIIKDPVNDPKESFERRYSDLKKYLHEKRVEMDSGMDSRAKTSWTLRTQVMHYAMNPNDEELSIIVKWTRNVIDNLTRASSNVPEG